MKGAKKWKKKMYFEGYILFFGHRLNLLFKSQAVISKNCDTELTAHLFEKKEIGCL